MNKIQKRFPATTSLDEKTFLNDNKIDAELYAYLQTQSYPDIETKETRVFKKNLPSQKDIAEKIFNVSRNTIVNHLKYLKDQGYIIDKGDYYLLPNKEEIFFKIPLDLLNFFIDTLKEPVIKTYIYLGQRFNYKPHDYVFTEREIAEHIGVDYNNNSKKIAHYLIALENLGLIKVAEFYENNTPLKRLINFSTQIPQ